MKFKIYLLKISSLLFLINIPVFSQPLSGSYTIGGVNPDFATLQDAATALKLNGISSSVFFNIRPGIYMRNGGNNTVLKLDTIIAGSSSTNRITFQPDEIAGGNTNNVILRFNRTNLTTADKDLVRIQIDFVTIRNLTLEDIDSSHTFDNHLIRLQQLPGNLNPTVDGIIVEGCTFKGTPHIRQGNSFVGTDFGLGSIQTVKDLTIRGNTFSRLLRAVSVVNGSAVSQGNITVEDNIILEGYRSASGSGNPLGAGIEISCTTAVVRKNIIDFNNSVNSGNIGIFVFGAVTGTVEKNSIKGISVNGILVRELLNVLPNSISIANNIITGSTNSISCEARNTKIVFNTIVVPSVSINPIAFRVIRSNCEVYNNIIHLYATQGFTVVYDQGNQQSPNLISDYNIFYKSATAGNGPIALRNGLQYPTLAAYQTATGLDTNSIFKEVEFLNLSDDLHLTDCQSQDPELKGIPIPGITEDIDGEVRNGITPMIGADENSFRNNDMFGDSFRTSLPGIAFSIASGKFDNLLNESIAVPDYDNNKIYLYHNNGDKTFTKTGTIETLWPPTVVKFYDFDDDTNLDLIVGYDTSIVQVFWGNGLGSFPVSSTEETLGRVRSIEPGGPSVQGAEKSIVITQDNGFLPNASWLGYLLHLGNREICHEVQSTSNIGPDTIFSVMNDLVIAELGNDGGFKEVAAITIGVTPPLVIIRDIQVFGAVLTNCSNLLFDGNVEEFHLGSPAGYNNSSSIVSKDFDGDGDIDLITTGADSDELVFIKNEGNFNFTSTKIPVRNARALVSMDYENDGDFDIVTTNGSLEDKGLSVFLNDGSGNFTERLNCFFPFATGEPWAIIPGDFDRDGKTDVALVSTSLGGGDSLFVLYNLGGGVSNAPDERLLIPDGFKLSQNYPNPFNPSTTIEYSIPEESNVEILVFNILGEKVAELIKGQLSPGNHKVNFNASDLSSGIYFYSINAKAISGNKDFISAKKMMLLK